ncbi:hypothetical protein AAG906_021038 [Vitis piasezkii]
MFEAIQYFVSSKKLEDGFGMDNVAVVNGRGKITRLCDDNMGLDLKFIHNNIARGLWHIFLQDIHVLALHGPNGLKIIIDQIIAKN